MTNLLTNKFDLVIANDVETLPLAFRFTSSCILFDAHEYAPLHFEDKLTWRIFFQGFNTWLCKKYIHRTDAMITVGEGLAREYAKHFNVTPVIISNATNYYDIAPTKNNGQQIRLIHHGGFNKSRKFELMVELMDLLDERFTLDLMFVIPEFASKKTRKYFDDFKLQSEKKGKIKFLPPVNSNEIVQKINGYDLGVFLLPPVNFNYKNTLPNKLFDFIQARLGVAIGPTPEMASIVTKYDLGLVSEDFSPEDLAKKLNALTAEDINRFKNNASIAAKELNAEKNKMILKQIIQDMIETRQKVHSDS